jgi:hypothetical protein
MDITKLDEVVIVTTSDGPFAEDLFWVLRSGDREEVIPSGYATNLLETLQRLPGFDNEAVIRAMGSTSDARFIVWRRSKAS